MVQGGYNAVFTPPDSLDAHLLDVAPVPWEWLRFEIELAAYSVVHARPIGPKGLVWSLQNFNEIDPLVEAGLRVLAPDLVGFGRSDKPAKRTDYTYQRHVDWMTAWLEAVDVQRYVDVWRERHGTGSVNLITARGCPYRCRWCSHAVFGYTHRRRSPAGCADELRWIMERYAPDQVWYADDVFTINHRWLFGYGSGGPDNARDDRLATSPLWRGLWMVPGRHVVIPVSHGYEATTRTGRRRWYAVVRHDGEPLLVPGLGRVQMGPFGTEWHVTMVTVDAGPVFEPIHDTPREIVCLRDWKEVYLPYPVSDLQTQAARCMDCGVPFCHQGCPLGNLIPDWNDLVYRDRWREAIERLHATNNFPEWTGCLCPAPCEGSCVLGINDDAVTIKAVELEIIEHAFAEGWITAQLPAVRTGRKVAVVGSGPAGLAAAQQLNRAGHWVVVFERADRIGGLLRYGIPEFKMEKRVLDRRLDQMRQEGVRFVTGAHVGQGVPIADLRRDFDALLLTGGACAPRDLPIPGRELGGIHFAMEFLPQQNKRNAGDDEAKAAPNGTISAEGKHVVVIGGGDTGSDCIGTSFRQGALSVTQIHAGDAYNVIPQTARLSGTVRAFSNEVMQLIGRNLARIAEGVAAGFGARAQSDFRVIFAPLVNHAAEAEFARLSGDPILRPFRLGLLHGRLKPDEKQAVMDAFAAGRVQALVTTTVVEVGVDVPNATLMVVENADRYGLSQLYQLRGRVGRGAHRSVCVLIPGPLATARARERLAEMTRTDDGFALAEADLRLRGEGDLWGTRQSGLPRLKLANLFRDEAIVLAAREAARELVARDARLTDPGHAPLREALVSGYREPIELALAG